MPRIDPIRNAFSEKSKRSRYSISWLELTMILLSGVLISFSFWFQAPAGGVKPVTPTPKPPVAPVAPPAVAIMPGVPRVGPPAVPPVKAAAARAVAVATSPKPPAKPGDPVVLSVGDEHFTKSQFEAIVSALPDQFKAQLATPAGKREFAKQYAEMKSLALEAKKKMQQDEKLRPRWQLQVDQTLANLFMQEATKVDEATLRKYYDEHQNEFENANGRHILIRFKGSPVALKPDQKELTEEEALAKVNDIKKRLAAGEDFAAIAKKESDDTGSGAAGGSLGDFPRGMMVPAFDQVAFSIPVGQLSDPVKTQFGYHVIQIQSRKSAAFEEAKPQIEKRQKPEIGRKVLEDVKKRNVVVLDEAYFGKA